MTRARGLFSLGGVGGLHHHLDEVAGGEEFLHQGSEVFLGEVVHGLFVGGVAVFTVLEVELNAIAPPGVVLTAFRQVLLEIELCGFSSSK